MADPLSVAGLAIGAVSLGVQLADGTRKAFVFLENALHADEKCKAFACDLAVEHARFDTWTKVTHLDDVPVADHPDRDPETKKQTTDEGRFDRLARYCGPAILPVLSEMHVIMTQLADLEGTYSELIDVKSNNPGIAITAVTAAPASTIDIADPNQATQSAGASASHLSASIRSQVPKLVTGQRSSQSIQKPRKTHRSFLDIFERVSKSGKVLVTEPRRYLWVLKDDKACNARLRRLQRLNDFLEEALDRSQRDELIESTEQFKLMFIHFQADVTAALRAMMTAPTQAGAAASYWSEDTLVEGSGSPSQISRRTNVSNNFMARAAAFVLEVYQSSNSDIDLDPGFQMSIQAQMSNADTRQTFELPNGQRGWVEWKGYQLIDPTGEGEKLIVDPGAAERINRLVTILRISPKPEEFCVPQCLGYYDDEDRSRFALVYQCPMEAISGIPVSLLSCFGVKHVPLTSRLHIATRLAEWLLHLHSIRWLHKGIRSANILFLPRAGGSQFDDPLITGFDHARHDSPGQRTTKPGEDALDNIYVHPDYVGRLQAGGYRKIYDIYSLGIVLIELAIWKSMEKILSESISRTEEAQAVGGAEAAQQTTSTITGRVISPGDVALLRERMLTGRLDVLEEVKAAVGQRYHDVVRACLEGMTAFGLPTNADEFDRRTSTELLEGFSETVIAPLRRIVV